MSRIVIAFSVAGLLALTAAAPVAASAVASATLTIQGDPVQPANAPVLLDLLVRNTGPGAISYWCGGPGDFPDGNGFVANLTRSDNGEPWAHVRLSNGQDSSGSGRAFVLSRGRFVRVPSALGVLPPGEYDVTVEGAADGRMHDGAVKAVTWPATRSANRFHLTVRDDGQLAAARDEQIVAGVRKHDPFARHLASTWPRPTVRAELMKDLMGDEIVAADWAADGLFGDPDAVPVDAPPPGAPLLTKVILKHLAPPKDGSCDVGLITTLLKYGGPSPAQPPELRLAIARLAEARRDGPVFDRAAASLRMEVNGSLNSVEVEAAVEAAARIHGPMRPLEDPAVLDKLILLARSGAAADRRIAYRGLADYPSVPTAIQAVRRGFADDDRDCRNEANVAFALVTRVPATQPGTAP